MCRKLIIDGHRVRAENYGRHNGRADNCNFDAHHRLTRIRPKKSAIKDRYNLYNPAAFEPTKE